MSAPRRLRESTGTGREPTRLLLLCRALLGMPCSDAQCAHALLRGAVIGPPRAGLRVFVAVPPDQWRAADRLARRGGLPGAPGAADRQPVRQPEDHLAAVHRPAAAADAEHPALPAAHDRRAARARPRAACGSARRRSAAALHACLHVRSLQATAFCSHADKPGHLLLAGASVCCIVTGCHGGGTLPSHA